MDIWRLIENKNVDIICPGCGIHKRVSMKDISLERVVFCSSCENKIKLKDRDASATNARQGIKQIENKIKNMFKNFNL